MTEKYRGYIISADHWSPSSRFEVRYEHEDRDPDPEGNDNRYGYGPDVQSCKDQIDDVIEDDA